MGPMSWSWQDDETRAGAMTHLFSNDPLESSPVPFF